MRTVECVVVGGGPAGLAAAAAAARAGVEVLLADENLQLGGQYYRQLPAAFRALDPASDPELEEGRRLISEVQALGVEVALGTIVWGIFDQRIVAMIRDERAARVEARTLILAPGAYDRPVPFPGWTLPGVLTAGGAQNLMKAYRVLPGRRVLVAGSGPLLLAVADRLVRGGARVEALCEAAPLQGLWHHAPRLVPHLTLVRRGYHYWRALRRAGVPVLRGHVIRRALGTAEVTGAVIARCDGAGQPVAGTERTLAVDAVVVGYGFLPSVELARLTGCEHRYDPVTQAWLPVRTAELESTVPGVFVVGDGAGVAGAVVALAEGTLAGLAAARRLDRLSAAQYAQASAPVRRRLRRLAGFRRAMDALYRPGAGLATLADPDTPLCRCEEVSVGEALEAIREGAVQLNEVKAWTRIGMGRCQGRMCGPPLAQLIARVTGTPVPEAGTFTPRPPTKPVPLAALAGEEDG